MKIMKKISAVILSLLIASSGMYAGGLTASADLADDIADIIMRVVYSVAFSAENDITWSLDDNGTLTISGNGKIADQEGKNSTPWSLSKSSVKSLVIEDGVTEIGDYVFACLDELTEVTIPNSVTSIGDYAFSECTSLTNITIPNSVTSIGEYVFYGCNISTIVIPDSLKSLCGNTFAKCGLTSITVGKNNERYCDIDGVLFSKNKTTVICFPEGKKVNSYSIPDGVTAIGPYAFYGCTNLTEIVIPSSIESIDSTAYMGCSSVSKISVEKSNKIYDSRNNCNAIIETKSNTLIKGCCNTVIPDRVESIGDYAFYGCTQITKMTIPDSVNSIGDYAFYGCTQLEAINIQDDTVIGMETFSETKYYTEYYKNEDNWENGVLYIGSCLIKAKNSLSGRYEIKSGTTTISPKAFYGCTKLTEAVIPSSVENVGDHAFYECSGLKSVTFTGDSKLASIGDHTFSDCECLTNITIPDGITSIGKYAFEKCTNLTSITIPENVTSIGKATFSQCESLISITIPDSVTNIGDYAFNECSGLTDITIPSSVTSIGNLSFSNCEGLTSITIPDSVTNIGNSAFSFCTGLTDITLPVNITSISYWAFYNCTGLTNITIPEGVTSIGKNAFKECTNLKDITIPDSIASIDEGAFGDCTNLEYITIPSSVTSIGENAFYMVNDIEYYGELAGSPWGAKAINAYREGDLYYYNSDKRLLLGCSSDSNGQNYDGVVTIPKSVEEIGEYCFYDCDNITAINYADEDGSLVIGQDAFTDCDNLKTVNAGSNTINGITFSTASADTSSSSAMSRASSDSGVTVVNGNEILFCNKPGSADSPGSVTVDDNSITIDKKTQNITITAISQNAFSGCTNTEVTLKSDNITRIGEDAFLDSENYNNAAWTDGVFTLGNYVIEAKDTVTDYTVGSSIVCIADSAFAECENLKNIDMSSAKSLIAIGSNVFEKAVNLASFNIPASVRRIGSGAFSGCANFTASSSNKIVKKGNTVISAYPGITDKEVQSCLDSGITCIADGAFSGCTGLTSVKIPEGVTQIGENAFENCTSLESVTLPSSLEKIGKDAFRDCRSLKQMTIPAKVSEIGDFAFYGCDSLEAFAVGSNTYPVVNGVLFKGTTLVQYPAAKSTSEYTVGADKSVSKIESFAFRNSRKLNTVTVGSSVKLGTRNPFEGSSALFSDGTGADPVIDKFTDLGKTLVNVTTRSDITSYEVPETVTKIGSNAFANNKYITSVKLDDNITTIGEEAFKNCTGLTEIYLPKNLTTIEASAFEGCTNLKTVHFWQSDDNTVNETLNTIGKDAFKGCKITDCNIVFSDGTCVLDNDNLTIVSPGINLEKVSEEPTCTEKGKDEIISYTAQGGKLTKTVESYDIPAAGHTDPDKDGICNKCGTALAEYMLERVSISAPSDVKVDYKNKVKFTVTASELPEGYTVVLYENGNEKTSGSSPITYTSGELKSNTEYTVKVIAPDGSAAKKSDGSELTRSFKVSVNAGFLQKIVAFFRGIFGSQPTKSI